jgi:hypothetical protein
METDLYIMNIDTRYKLEAETNAADYTYNLVTPLKNINSIKLSSLEFPNVNYIFSNNKNSNTFTIIYKGANIPIKIPEGIYSPCSIVDAINVIFTSMTTTAYSSGTSTNFKMYYNPATFKAIIINDTPFGLNFDNTYPDGKPNNNKSLGTLLGFRQTIYTQSTNIPVISALGNTAGYGYMSESVLDTQGDTYILVKINNYGNIIHESLDYVTIDNTTSLIKKTDNYFAKILLYGAKGTIIFDTCANFITKIVNLRQPENIAKLHITLHEPNGDIIQLLNFDYSLTLEFTYIVSSVLKNNSEGGLLNHSKLDAPKPDIMATPLPKQKERFSDIMNMFENGLKFKENRYIQEKEKHYNEKSLNKIKNKLNKPVVLNNALFEYNMENVNIHKDKKKKKKKKPKFTINY